MSMRAIVRSYIQQIRPQAQVELDWFRRQPSLHSAIDVAARAINSSGKRYSHQCRLKKVTLKRARQRLLARSAAIGKCRSFDYLFALLNDILKLVDGIGELYVYDTALRIGANLRLLPEKVYLHTGTRIGARALGFAGTTSALEISAFPPEFQELEPHEIEDVLCIFKDDLARARPSHSGNLSKRSWCG